MTTIKYTAGQFTFFLKIHEKIVLEYKKKSSKEWKRKNYASTTNRAKMEKDILKISGSGKFKIVGMWEE